MDEIVRKMSDDMIRDTAKSILGEILGEISYGIVPEEGNNISCITADVGDKVSDMFFDPDNNFMTIDDAVEVCKYIGKSLCKNMPPVGSDTEH